MISICAWCERYLTAEEPQEISHGICALCRSRLDWRDSPTLTLSARHRDKLPVIAHLLRGTPPIRLVIEKRKVTRRRGGGPPKGKRRRRHTGSD